MRSPPDSPTNLNCAAGQTRKKHANTALVKGNHRAQYKIAQLITQNSRHFASPAFSTGFRYTPRPGPAEESLYKIGLPVLRRNKHTHTHAHYYHAFHACCNSHASRNETLGGRLTIAKKGEAYKKEMISIAHTTIMPSMRAVTPIHHGMKPLVAT